jgi:hypothetical protein
MALSIRERRYLRGEISGVRQYERFVHSWVVATRTAFLFRLLYGMAVVTEPVLCVSMAC